MAFAESYLPHENDTLSSFSLREQIHTITDVIDNPLKTRRLAESQGLGQYSDEDLHVHYKNHKAQYQQFYDMLHGKKLISEQQVQQTISGGRRGR